MRSVIKSSSKQKYSLYLPDQKFLYITSRKVASNKNADAIKPDRSGTVYDVNTKDKDEIGVYLTYKKRGLLAGPEATTHESVI